MQCVPGGAFSADGKRQFVLIDLFVCEDGNLLALFDDGNGGHTVQAWIAAARSTAHELLQGYFERISEIEAKIQANEHWAQTSFPDRHFVEMSRYYGENDKALTPRPKFTDLQLEPRRAVFIEHPPQSQSRLACVVVQAVRTSRRGMARDGVHRITRMRGPDNEACAMVQWEPRGIATPALELKAAIERTLPSALARPRNENIHPPDPIADRPATRIDIDASMPDDGSDQGDLGAEGAGRDAVRQDGFDAIAWYQPFHCYTDRAWGIYFSAKMLDDAIGDFTRDLRRAGERCAQLLARRLVIGMVMAHEMFHARLEFCSSWLELSHRRRRYLDYHAHVYCPLKSTSEWREEALANWTSQAWAQEELPNLVTVGLVSNPDAVMGVIKDWLDFSPAGYRDWRIGQWHVAWRTLANEIRNGQPLVDTQIAAPIESLIRDPSLLDLRSSDIPTYAVGRGTITDLLFSAPTRREAENLLRSRGYVCVSAQGKGSHQKWRAPSGAQFPIPHQTTLSVDVFHKLLRHLGMTKAEYVQWSALHG